MTSGTKQEQSSCKDITHSNLVLSEVSFVWLSESCGFPATGTGGTRNVLGLTWRPWVQMTPLEHATTLSPAANSTAHHLPCRAAVRKPCARVSTTDDSKAADAPPRRSVEIRSCKDERAPVLALSIAEKRHVETEPVWIIIFCMGLRWLPHTVASGRLQGTASVAPAF